MKPAPPVINARIRKVYQRAGGDLRRPEARQRVKAWPSGIHQPSVEHRVVGDQTGRSEPFSSPFGGRPPHYRPSLRVEQQLDQGRGQGSRVGRHDQAGDPVLHHLGRAPHVGRDAGDAGHRRL